MEAFTTLTGIAAPLPAANVDTDVIMPKQFLKGIDRRFSSGFQENRIFHHTAKQVFGNRNPLRCFHNEKTGGYYEHQK